MKLLGVGAAGCAYEAEWQGQRVAVKLMHPTTADQKSFIRYAGLPWLRGAETASELAGLHPCLAGCMPAARSCRATMHHPAPNREPCCLSPPCREVETQAALGRHPFIIGVLAACLEPPLAVVQELAAGSLHDQLHRCHLRPRYGTLLQLAEDIAAALEHCHMQRPPVVSRHAPSWGL